ncbi:MAG: Nif3-like dinuclear metal center hexameric protein [Gammaproteobacteria bacterium]|nr:Nif3-like dinuclear metal center hexameric protein [Gammaproteobacteria bacterium]
MRAGTEEGVDAGELAAYLDRELAVDRFRDYCPNGLQVAGDRPVRRLLAGVTASRALIEQAIARDADTLLVHHGYFWKGEDPRVVGIKRDRLALLLGHGLSLLAYHLPLDAHPRWGNNVGLAEALGWAVEGGFAGDPPIALRGRVPEPVSAEALADRIESVLGRRPLLIPGGGHLVGTLGWCTGAAQDGIEEAAALGLDAFISGEISERTVHFAREAGIHYFAAGHHATETFGVKALAAHLAERFGLDWSYAELDNPV